ncbi:hypothetical protein KM043_008627 [Ampulex compressa]|nr:hypothetical protein KM043_008627 [Ampulex compressa]
MPERRQWGREGRGSGGTERRSAGEKGGEEEREEEGEEVQEGKGGRPREGGRDDRGGGGGGGGGGGSIVTRSRRKRAAGEGARARGKEPFLDSEGIDGKEGDLEPCSRQGLKGIERKKSEGSGVRPWLKRYATAEGRSIKFSRIRDRTALSRDRPSLISSRVSFEERPGRFFYPAIVPASGSTRLIGFHRRSKVEHRHRGSKRTRTYVHTPKTPISKLASGSHELCFRPLEDREHAEHARVSWKTERRNRRLPW